MKKIGLVLSQPPSYSETFFNSKIKGLQDSGYRITLFTGTSKKTYPHCPHKKSPCVHKSVWIQICHMFLVGFTLLPHLKAVQKFYKLEKNEGASIKRIFEKIYLNSHLLKFKGDWLHFGFATLAIDREFVAQAAGARMAVSFRGYDINVYPLKHPGCYGLLWQQVDKVQSISNYLLEKAHELGLPKITPYKIITPAVDLNTLPIRTVDENYRGLKLVTIARFNWIKGIDYLIEVATNLKSTGLDFQWLVIGDGPDFEKERYLYHIHEKGLEQLVVLKGKCSHSETLKLLASADVYVQTSLNEGFCNAVLEAQALGIPSVAFNVGGLPENIQNKKTGWLVETYNTKVMAETILMVYGLTTLDKKSISEQAKKRVQDNFSLEQQKEAFYEFFMN